MQARSGCAQRVRGLGGSGRFLGVNSLVRAGHSGRFDAPSLLRATLWLQPKMALACAVWAWRSRRVVSVMPVMPAAYLLFGLVVYNPLFRWVQSPALFDSIRVAHTAIRVVRPTSMVATPGGLGWIGLRSHADALFGAGVKTGSNQSWRPDCHRSCWLPCRRTRACTH